jgi:hypothetical protein
MSLGYNRPLYLLPFDHRHSYVTDMFSFMPPLTADEHEAVAASKQVIYDGFRQTLDADPDIVVQLFAGHMTNEAPPQTVEHVVERTGASGRSEADPR